MGIAQSVSLWLKGRGHDALHLNDEGLYKLEDRYILEKAINENRIILTTDMDFGQLLAIDKLTRPAVIQFRTSDFSSLTILKKLELLFEDFSSRLNEEFIITIEDYRIRYRRLPI
jgi:predicted nuclease of predicted toxin-antitoxin system